MVKLLNNFKAAAPFSHENRHWNIIYFKYLGVVVNTSGSWVIPMSLYENFLHVFMPNIMMKLKFKSIWQDNIDWIYLNCKQNM